MILAKTLVSNNIPFEQHVSNFFCQIFEGSKEFFFAVLSGRGSLLVWRQGSLV